MTFQAMRLVQLLTTHHALCSQRHRTVMKHGRHSWCKQQCPQGPRRAQTIAYEDFIQFKGEAGAKEAGKMRAEGKEYVVKDGDVLNFLFNV